MERQNLLSRFGELWQSAIVTTKKKKLPVDDIISVEDYNHVEPVTIREDEKVTVEIREIVRIRPQDFQALKSSFEDWAQTWD
jgi:hypothetical protein